MRTAHCGALDGSRPEQVVRILGRPDSSTAGGGRVHWDYGVLALTLSRGVVSDARLPDDYEPLSSSIRRATNSRSTSFVASGSASR